MDGAGAVVTSFSGMLAGVANIVACVLFVSWARTFNFRSLSISKTSLGNGISSTFGHSHSSCHIFLSICSRVTVSRSHQFAGLVLVVCFWFLVMVSVGDMVAPFTLVSSVLQVLSFFAAFFQILSMVVCNSTFANRDRIKWMLILTMGAGDSGTDGDSGN